METEPETRRETFEHRGHVITPLNRAMADLREVNALRNEVNVLREQLKGRKP